MEAGYVLAFTTGLLGGFGHCTGMCGPIVASYALRGRDKDRRNYSILVPHLLYNAGRITTYVFIGALMGLSGSFINSAGKISGLQNFAEMAAGLFMIAMGLSITGLFKGAGYIEKHNSLIFRMVKAVSEGGSASAYFPLGLILGFLPCGLSYSIFIGAAGLGSLPKAMLFVFCFGAGTIPALLLVGLAANFIGIRTRGLIYRSSGLIVTATGVYFLIRALKSHAAM